MPLALTFDEFRAYNEEQRAVWDVWFRAYGTSIFTARLQPGAAFGTVWQLLDHIFVVERRHLQRLRGEYPLPETTGVAETDWSSLQAYAAETRGQLISFVASLREDEVDQPREVPIWGRPHQTTARKLLFHVLLHEARHWAQISLAIRKAGLEPPPDQDLVFSSALA